MSQQEVVEAPQTEARLLAKLIRYEAALEQIASMTPKMDNVGQVAMRSVRIAKEALLNVVQRQEGEKL